LDIRDRVNQSIKQTKTSQLLNWIPRVGLLILLDDYYGRSVKKSIPLNPFDLVPATEQLQNLRNWAKTFSPLHILMLCGMKMEQLEKFYTNLSLHARKIDPISELFLLQRLIKKSRRYDLKNKALLAQEYYGYLFMAGQFILDISHKKMLEPDDVCRGDGGKWKERIYGEPFDYDTKKTQNQILKHFLVDRPIELVIIVEGETEEKVIELILEARGVDRERDGFFVYNIRGQDNLLHLKPLFRVSQLIDITIFGFVDNDRNVNNKIQKMKQYARDLEYEKDIRIHIWDRDFETDNFGIEKVVCKVNQILSEKGYTKVQPLEVESRMERTGDALIKTVEKEIWRVNVTKGIKSGKIISKPRLAKLLIEDRLNEIQIENEPEWIAKLPVEKELKKIFELIPSFM
jgi:Overcoming lysogenization defect protein-like, TOPRIM domain